MASILRTISSTLKTGLLNGNGSSTKRVNLDYEATKFFFAHNSLQRWNAEVHWWCACCRLRLRRPPIKDVSFWTGKGRISLRMMIKCILQFAATVRKRDEVARSSLLDFGKYVADCLPKYVQKVQFTAGDELEVLISPDGVVPVLQFLKDHHNGQFASLADIAGMDVPSRKYRFEVSGTVCAVHVFSNGNAHFLNTFFRLSTICCRWDTIRAFVSRRTLTKWRQSIQHVKCSRRPIGTNVKFGICTVFSLPIIRICVAF